MGTSIHLVLLVHCFIASNEEHLHQGTQLYMCLSGFSLDFSPGIICVTISRTEFIFLLYDNLGLWLCSTLSENNACPNRNRALILQKQVLMHGGGGHMCAILGQGANVFPSLKLRDLYNSDN